MRVEDILEAIANAQAYIAGMRYEDFTDDLKTIRAVAYEIGTIGEAAAQMPESVTQRWPSLPWDKMRAMRNIVFHEYFRVDTAILWQTVTSNFPPLVPLLRAMLNHPP